MGTPVNSIDCFCIWCRKSCLACFCFRDDDVDHPDAGDAVAQRAHSDDDVADHAQDDDDDDASDDDAAVLPHVAARPSYPCALDPCILTPKLSPKL